MSWDGAKRLKYVVKKGIQSIKRLSAKINFTIFFFFSDGTDTVHVWTFGRSIYYSINGYDFSQFPVSVTFCMTLNKVVTQVPVEHACSHHSETLQLSWRKRKKQRNDIYGVALGAPFSSLLRPFFTFGYQSCVQYKMRFLPLAWFMDGVMCSVTVVIHQYFSISVWCSILRKAHFRIASISYRLNRYPFFCTMLQLQSLRILMALSVTCFGWNDRHFMHEESLTSFLRIV